MNTLTKLDIWNLALSHLGVASRVGTLADVSANAVALRAAWPSAVEAVLRQVDWPFAERRAPLPELTAELRAVGFVYGPSSRTFPAESISAQRSDWAYCYILPYGCMKVRELAPSGSREHTTGTREAFCLGAEVDPDAAGDPISPWAVPVVFTNLPEAEAIYTADMSSYLDVWDPLAVLALSYALASLVAWTNGKPEVRAAMVQLYKQTLSAAAASSLNEPRFDKPADSAFVSGRF